MSGKNSMRWGVEKRLEFIEFQLYWEGHINRSDVKNKFGISTPQASSDIKTYMDVAPRNIKYNKNQKRYLIGEKFEPKFISLDPSRYLLNLKLIADEAMSKEDSWLSFIPEYCTIPIPHRNIAPKVLRDVLRAIKGLKSIRIQYQSLSEKEGGAKWRHITPYALASDGLRWHTRAYCHTDKVFKDFILSRILDTGELGDALAEFKDDKLWHTFVDVELMPNPKLSTAQRKIIALDYGMKREKAIIPIRQALLYYFQTRLCLDRPITDNPYATPLIVGNRGQLDKALAEVTANQTNKK